MPSRAEDGNSPVPAVPIPAVAYVRVSTAREQMISPELQKAAIEDAARRDGAVIAAGHWIVELDESGRGFGRKGVQQAIRLMREGVVQRCYVWKYSRFGRNATLSGQFCAEMEAVAGPRALVSATEDVSHGTAAGKFARGVLWQVDEFYSNVVGENWMEAHARRRRDGLPHNGNPRFGYAYHHPATETRPCPQGCDPGACVTGYVPDPVTGPAARAAYEAYNAGTSVLKIAVGLNGRGLLTTSGKPWDQRTLRRYMDSGFCAGLLRVHDPACGHPVRPCKRKVLVPGAHEPLIGQETWEEYLRQRAARRNLPPRAETPVYPLAGLVACGRCDGPLNATSMRYAGVRKPGYMYQCARYAKSRECAGTFVARGRVEKAVLAWLARYAGDPDRAAAAMKGRARGRASAEAGRRRLAGEAAAAERALTELTVQLAREVITAEAYIPARDEIAARRGEIGAALEALGPPQAAREPSREAALTLIAGWDLLPVKTRQLALRAFIAGITVESHGKQRVTLTLTSAWGDVYVLSL